MKLLRREDLYICCWREYVGLASVRTLNFTTHSNFCYQRHSLNDRTGVFLCFSQYTTTPICFTLLQTYHYDILDLPGSQWFPFISIRYENQLFCRDLKLWLDFWFLVAACHCNHVNLMKCPLWWMTIPSKFQVSASWFSRHSEMNGTEWLPVDIWSDLLGVVVLFSCN